MADLALDGKRVMAILGIGAGPEVGDALMRLLDIVIENPDMNSEEILTEKLKEMRVTNAP
jgi:hypothetical protein